jgi:ribosomal 30S subunit maturation factor RimM
MIFTDLQFDRMEADAKAADGFYVQEIIRCQVVCGLVIGAASI